MPTRRLRKSCVRAISVHSIAKRALQEIYPVDSAEAALVDASEMHAARFFDIGLAAYLLNQCHEI